MGMLQNMFAKPEYLEWDEYKDLILELEHHWFMYQNCVQNIRNTLARLKVV
jgi:hypothetical protein